MILCSDPRAQYLAYKSDIDKAIAKTLDSGRYILGDEVRSFEEEFATYTGVEYAVGVGNGTDALELSLAACSISSGDEVITVSHTATATVAAIKKTGATPRFLDISDQTFVLDASLLEKAITPNTRAIIPVHLYGHMVDMEPVMEIAQKHRLMVIEDCAQAHGAELHGAKAGTFGDMACFSFYPTKNLGALGDGGAVVSSNKDIADKVRELREYGWRERFVSDAAGWNSRLDEIQAAVLRVKLKHLDEMNGKRRDLAEIYKAGLEIESQALPVEMEGFRHVYHLFVLKTLDRDSLLDFLNNRNILAGVHYPTPVHRQPAFETGANLPLPITDSIAESIISLPMYPELGGQVNDVITAVNEFFG